MKNDKRGLFVCLLLGVSVMLFAQDDFGFGFDDEDSGDASFGSGAPLAVNIGGEVGMAMLGYTDDVSQGFSHVWRPGRIDGRLDFSASGSFGEAVINLKLNPAGFITQLQGESDSTFNGFSNIIALDEAYARAWFGNFEIEAGMRKLTWGKADSLGPLDVINPLDYSELTSLSDVMNIKIANALIHGSYRFGQFSKIETLFVPVFEPWHFASKGRWAPAQMSKLSDSIGGPLQTLAASTGATITNDDKKKAFLQQYAATSLSGMAEAYPDTTTLDYAQAGLRFTTTIGSADIGAQYYYGWLGQPAIDMAAFSASMQTAGAALAVATDQASVDAALQKIATPIVYNRYHQIGVDWAQVFWGFNVRAELAANITDDLEGDDGAVYNPHLAWSFGFDRDLVWGINLNLQANETVKLFYDKISDNPLDMDTEAGTDMTSTRLTAALSKKFLRDELELRAAALWGIEDSDFLIMPAIIWTRDAVQVEVSGGFFGGDEEGQLGQYHENSFIKVGIKYSF